ncbi:MAG: sigma-70 family RNA polymerase sigma factor [Chitinophagaceae bacterium]|nr:sigma-70 family RNA polymerase sigma factor [Chitinophagaceae bacterium]MBL0201392.1 sigma-70 family RNA polymerase sigma factor [Chitinophagaceae bacterium]
MKSYNHLNENELIQLYLNGDSHAFSFLVKRNTTKIFTPIYILVKDSYLAEDILQEVFIRIIKSLKNGAYVENGKFSQWAIRIAHNLCMDHFRKVKRTPTITTNDNFDIFDVYNFSEPAADVKLMQVENYDSIKKAIDKLPQDQREILILRHYADLSFREIAVLSGISINTALGRMRYALINIRKMLPESKLAS